MQARQVVVHSSKLSSPSPFPALPPFCPISPNRNASCNLCPKKRRRGWRINNRFVAIVTAHIIRGRLPQTQYPLMPISSLLPYITIFRFLALCFQSFCFRTCCQGDSWMRAFLLFCTDIRFYIIARESFYCSSDEMTPRTGARSPTLSLTDQFSTSTSSIPLFFTGVDF